MQLPAGSQLLLASRRSRRCRWRCCAPRARWWRSGSTSWRWTEREARALLEGAGAGLADADVDELLRRTEGWPVGLYLAALALKAGGPQQPGGPAFTGDDRFMADYLRSELLAHLPPEWWRS